MSDPLVYTIIVTHYGSNLIESCLQSLKRSTCPVHIVVVDNASTDETISIVSTYPDVVLISNAKNQGFGRANNIGIRYALDNNADYICLLNQDTTVEPETIAELVKYTQENRSYGIVSPVHLCEDGTQIDPRFFNHVARQIPNLFSDLFCKNLKEIYPIDFVNAAAWFVTRECLTRVGGFDPIFFMYGEDKDYCNRVQYHDFKIGIVPSSVIFHSRSGSAITNRENDLNMRSNILMAVVLSNLKYPSGSFCRHLISSSIAILFMMLDALLRKRDIRDFTALIFSVFRMTVNLPVIWRHRNLAKTVGPHWIYE